jgi:hypothetical protein
LTQGGLSEIDFAAMQQAALVANFKLDGGLAEQEARLWVHLVVANVL